MGVEVIYVVRHGYRMNWTVNPSTGKYSTTTPTPTGIPCDPELASYGVTQSHQLAKHLVSLEPEIDVIYCSPFYRCLQTLKPTIDLLLANDKVVKSVRVDNGIGEFFGAAHFKHPSPPSLDVLHEHFDFLNATHEPSIVPRQKGETLDALHARNAYALHKIISQVDAEPGGPRSILIGTHAASMICIGRVLTGRMPADPSEEDFRCGTCALSKYVRRTPGENSDPEPAVDEWDPQRPDHIPVVDWKNGKGVKAGWDCVWNGDCSFLDGGEERTWSFSKEASAPKAERNAVHSPQRSPLSSIPSNTLHQASPATGLSITCNDGGDVSPAAPNKAMQVSTEEVTREPFAMQEQAPAV